MLVDSSPPDPAVLRIELVLRATLPLPLSIPASGGFVEVSATTRDVSAGREATRDLQSDRLAAKHAV